MGQAAEGCFKEAQELQWSFQTAEGSNAALCWLNAGVKTQEIAHVGTLFLQVSPATEMAASPAFTLTVLLHTHSGKSSTSFYTRQLLLNITLSIHSR